MADKKDVISYDEYQKLPEEEKQNFETNWNSDGKSGTATRKGAKIPKVELTIPITGMNAYSSAAQDKPALGNGKLDKKDTDAADAEAKADTTATGKFNNPFQKEKEAADKAVEDANILLDRAKQLETIAAEKVTNSMYSKDRSSLENLSIISRAALPYFDEKLLKLEKGTESLAKDLGIDTGNLSELKVIGDTSTAYRAKKVKKISEELTKTAEERVAAAKAKQQEVQAKYTKAEEEEAAKRKAKSEPVPKAQKVAESTRNQLTEVTTKEQEAQAKYDKDQKEAETKTEKDETKDPLKKAEELEQPRAPADIKKFSNDLNRFVIQAYLNGDFGKKSNPNAIATMGFFILDKIGAALVNASEVARGMSPSAKSQWSDVLDKQTELLGKRITANWFLSLSREEQEALIRSGVISGTTGDTIYQTIDPNAVSRAEQKDVLEISKLSQEQKSVAQSNVNALLARKSELQTLITQLKSDQGWEVYAQAMNAVVGTAKGLNSLGVTDDSSSSSNKGFSDQLSVKVATGNVTKAFVSGGISNNSSWNNSSTEALNKSKSLNQDALALSKFKSGEDYAKATREAKKAANEQLIKRLEGQIEIIDKCIDSWGKDLGL